MNSMSDAISSLRTTMRVDGLDEEAPATSGDILGAIMLLHDDARGDGLDAQLTARIGQDAEPQCRRSRP